MLKKLFALASVTALTGVVASVSAAGCSSTSTTTETPTDSGTGSKDSGGAKEAGGGGQEDPTEDDAGSTPACPPDTDPVAGKDIDDALQSQLGISYKDATPPATSCTAGDITAFDSALKSASAGTTYDDFAASVKAAVSATCYPCLISDGSSTWQPLVIVPTKGGFFNDGACEGALEGNSCGHASFLLSQCIEAECLDCAGDDDNAYDKCTTAALKGACKTILSDAQTACPKAAAGDATCGTLDDSIKYLCGGGSAGDGGADGGN